MSPRRYRQDEEHRPGRLGDQTPRFSGLLALDGQEVAEQGNRSPATSALRAEVGIEINNFPVSGLLALDGQEVADRH